MSSDILTLRAGALTLDIGPACGGSIFRLQQTTPVGLLEWLRPASDDTIARCNPMGVASFPLVPYSNRIREGRFPLGDVTAQLPLNWPPERHALHGDGWQHPWTVGSVSDTEAELLFDWAEPAHVLRYTARQHFELLDAELQVEISVTNRGDGPMPAGIGMHPWFPLTPQARLTADLPSVWLVDHEYMPVERAPTPPRLDFSRGLAFAGTNVANSFSGWDGHAVIEWPEQRMRLTLLAEEPLRHLVLYAPDGGDFFCVEPVSNSVDAFNLGAQGVLDVGYIVLQPNETLSGRVRFLLETTA
jgi:aldose 1-epimerase